MVKSKVKNKKNWAAIVLVLFYIIVILIESFLVVPYNHIQVFRTEQNVPHKVITGNGYCDLHSIRYDRAYMYTSDSVASGKELNVPLLITNLFVTTLIFVAIYFLFVRKNIKHKENIDNNESNINAEYLYNSIKNNSASKIDNDDDDDIPILDVNSLAFADKATIYAEQKKYAKRMAEYLQNKKCH